MSPSSQPAVYKDKKLYKCSGGSSQSFDALPGGGGHNYSRASFGASSTERLKYIATSSDLLLSEAAASNAISTAWPPWILFE